MWRVGDPAQLPLNCFWIQQINCKRRHKEEEWVSCASAQLTPATHTQSCVYLRTLWAVDLFRWPGSGAAQKKKTDKWKGSSCLAKNTMHSRQGNFWKPEKWQKTNNGSLAKLIAAGGGNRTVLSAAQTTAFSPRMPEIWVTASNWNGEIWIFKSLFD